MALLGDIMTDRTRRYVRNVMAVSFVAVAVGWSGNLDLGGAKLFGVGFENEPGVDNKRSAEATFWTVMSVLWCYQVAAFGYSVKTDWALWRSSTGQIIRELAHQDDRGIHESSPAKAPTAVIERDVRKTQFFMWDVIVPATAAFVALITIIYRLYQLG